MESRSGPRIHTLSTAQRPFLYIHMIMPRAAHFENVLGGPDERKKCWHLIWTASFSIRRIFTLMKSAHSKRTQKSEADSTRSSRLICFLDLWIVQMLPQPQGSTKDAVLLKFSTRAHRQSPLRQTWQPIFCFRMPFPVVKLSCSMLATLPRSI